MTDTFPFDAVVGQDDAKLALRLAARDPLIGGVLLRGQKGSAKTTLARGLAAQLGDAPFVDLPLGATEDRVVGTLDTRAAIVDGEVRFEPGLLARAHGGVLYVDEINLLADHLVDVLLDVAVSGENVVERDGVSHRHPARFTLVGSMNPEEGELRPQFLDRFGLCVEVTAPTTLDERTEAVRRRLAFDTGRPAPTAPVDRSRDDEPAVPRTAGVPNAVIPDEVLVAASELAVAVGAEGLRADLTLCRAVAALADLEGRDVATLEDLRRVAPLVLAHRSRRDPFDPPVVPPSELDESIADILDGPRPEIPDGQGDPTNHDEGNDDEGNDDERKGESDGAEQNSAGHGRPWTTGPLRHTPRVAPDLGRSPRGRVVGDEPAGTSGAIAVIPTVRAIASRRHNDPGSPVQQEDLRSAVRMAPKSQAIVLCVDLSGSMGAPQRAAAASGTVLGLLTNAYQRRSQVGLVTFRGTRATTVLAPTRSIEVARNRLDDLTTGGATPLAEGIQHALGLAESCVTDTTDGLLAVLTDGRATGSGGMEAALDAARKVAASPVRGIVLDCEDGPRPLGMAAALAAAMGALHIPVPDLAPEHLVSAVQAASGR